MDVAGSRWRAARVRDFVARGPDEMRHMSVVHAFRSPFALCPRPTLAPHTRTRSAAPEPPDARPLASRPRFSRALSLEMGYAGYAPGHKVADLATPLQQYLKMVDLVASLDTLEKLTRNCAQAPAEEKFRKVRREDEPGRSEPRARSPARPARDARRRTRARSPAREPQISPRAERTPRASLQT
jgi:hypothetical protein